MSNFFELIEKYKFGLLAALSAYIIIFMYFQMDSYTKYFKIEPFHDGSYVEIPPEDIPLMSDNIMLPDDYQPGDIKNMALDANDDRKSSMTDYSDSRSASDVEKSVYDLENQFYRDAGGDQERERIRQNMENRNDDQKTTTTNKTDNSNQGSSDNKYGGQTMVKWSLKDRKPHQNDTYWVRNPGYTSYGNGTVFINISVNQNGNVISATYNAAQSSGATERMIEQALKYARMSRFNYSTVAAKNQTGWIRYTFVSN